jgi:hypothetical protein
VSIALLSTTVTAKKPFIPTTVRQKPNVTFLDSIMYQLDIIGVTKIIRSLKAYHYDKKDELFNATITTKSKNTKQPHTITAKYILKKQDKFTFKDDVILVNNKGAKLTTSYLNYDASTLIASNEHKFKLLYNKNILTGDTIYFDINLGIISAKNAKFKLKIKQ